MKQGASSKTASVIADKKASLVRKAVKRNKRVKAGKSSKASASIKKNCIRYIK